MARYGKKSQQKVRKAMHERKRGKVPPRKKGKKRKSSRKKK